MTSPIISEQFYAGAFVLRELPGFGSRTVGTVANLTSADVQLPGGLILSLAPPAVGTPAPLGTNTGNGTVSTLSSGVTALPGTYTINLESPAAFTLTDPTETEIAHGAVGTALTAGGLTFTLSAGSTPFAAGDAFTIPVASATGAYVPFTGVQRAAAILFGRAFVPAGGTLKATMLVQMAEVNLSEVQWDPGASPTAQTAAIASLGLRGIEFRATPLVGF